MFASLPLYIGVFTVSATVVFVSSTRRNTGTSWWHAVRGRLQRESGLDAIRHWLVRRYKWKLSSARESIQMDLRARHSDSGNLALSKRNTSKTWARAFVTARCETPDRNSPESTTAQIQNSTIAPSEALYLCSSPHHRRRTFPFILARFRHGVSGSRHTCNCTAHWYHRSFRSMETCRQQQ